MKNSEMFAMLEQDDSLIFEGFRNDEKVRYNAHGLFYLSNNSWRKSCSFGDFHKIDWQLKLPEIKPCLECGRKRFVYKHNGFIFVQCSALKVEFCTMRLTKFYGETKLDAINLANRYSKKSE